MKNAFYFLFFATAFITSSFANTEKLILEARSANVETYCNPQSNALSLRPPYTKIRQSLIPYTESNRSPAHWYHLDDLQDGSNYEIRISYPAITPADFKLKILHACKTSDHTISYVLDIIAKYTGVSQIKGKELEPIVYDLVLENLYAGVFFYQVYKIVIAIIGVLYLGQFVIIPMVKKLITKKVLNNKI